MDGWILLWIQENLRTPVLNTIFISITHLGDCGFIWIVLSAVLLCFKKTCKAGICSSIALAIMFITNDVIIKHLVNRTRPYEVVEGLIPLVKKLNSPSFPSGHASSAFAVTLILLILFPKKYSIPALVLVVLISFSRMYVGVHYPTDVLGGLIVGLLYGFAGYKIGNPVYDFINKRKSYEGVEKGV